MGHMIELAVEWAVFSIAIGLAALVAGFIIRAVAKREWSNLVIAEGAFAIGAVMGFVVLVFYEIAF